jgi:hypothetical protein
MSPNFLLRIGKTIVILEYINFIFLASGRILKMFTIGVEVLLVVVPVRIHCCCRVRGTRTADATEREEIPQIRVAGHAGNYIYIASVDGSGGQFLGTSFGLRLAGPDRH